MLWNTVYEMRVGSGQISQTLAQHRKSNIKRVVSLMILWLNRSQEDPYMSL